MDKHAQGRKELREAGGEDENNSLPFHLDN
jgi:hypothetical protein